MLLTSKIKSLINKNINLNILGVGVGAPCANENTGCIEAATNLPWPSPIPLQNLLEKELELKVKVTNDANAAAAGERQYGAAKGSDNFIMITLGTGVGSGIYCNGKLLSGSNGFAGELGHCSAGVPLDRLCACGRTGCLQTYCSAEGIATTARQLLENDNGGSLLTGYSPDSLTPKIIFDAAMKNDKIACETFRITGNVLGQACAEFASFTDPELIILFGGIAKSGDLIIKPMKEALNQNCLHLYRDKITIRQSSLPENDAALLGAAALIFSN